MRDRGGGAACGGWRLHGDMVMIGDVGYILGIARDEGVPRKVATERGDIEPGAGRGQHRAGVGEERGGDCNDGKGRHFQNRI